MVLAIHAGIQKTHYLKIWLMVWHNSLRLNPSCHFDKFFFNWTAIRINQWFCICFTTKTSVATNVNLSKYWYLDNSNISICRTLFKRYASIWSYGLSFLCRLITCVVVCASWSLLSSAFVTSGLDFWTILVNVLTLGM